MEVPAAAGAEPVPRTGIRVWDVLPAALVVTFATAAAATAYAHFRQAPRQLWTSAIHDRNAHYWLGLNFALDFRRADVVHFVSDLDAARVWPPLHALLVGGVLAVAGPDYRLAVLPSLAAWGVTALVAFLLARRLSPRGGDLAGALAALFVLASPAHRAFATDVMLESLGACLTLATLYAAVVLAQTGSVFAARGLALALTAGFLHKYNYWLLTVFALAAAYMTARPRLPHKAISALLSPAARIWFARELRHPFVWTALGSAGAAGLIALTGGTELRVSGRTLSLRSAALPVWLAYVCLAARAGGWYRDGGRIWLKALDPRMRSLVYGHIVPVAAWFLWPKRLASFLWFANPAANVGESPRADLFGGYAYYRDCLVRDYHVGAWAAGLTVALAAAAVLAAIRRRLRPGAGAVLWLVLISALVTAHHPNRKSRFLHSWVPALWVAAGAGLAGLAYSGAAANKGRARHLLAGASLAGATLILAPTAFDAGHAPEGGLHFKGPSTLDVTDSYLGRLSKSDRPAILCNLPSKFLSGWTLSEHFRRRAMPVTDLKGFGSSAEENRHALDAWLRSTDRDAIVFIDFRPGSPLYEPVPGPDYSQLTTLLPAQSIFAPAGHWELATCGCRVSLWRREPAPLAAR